MSVGRQYCKISDGLLQSALHAEAFSICDFAMEEAGASAYMVAEIRSSAFANAPADKSVNGHRFYVTWKYKFNNMQRRTFLRNTSLTLGALSLFNQKMMAAVMAENPWKMKMLRKDVGIFTEKGGTIGYLLSKSGIVTVDAEFPEQSQHLIDELKKQ